MKKSTHFSLFKCFRLFLIQLNGLSPDLCIFIIPQLKTYLIKILTFKTAEKDLMLMDLAPHGTVSRTGQFELRPYLSLFIFSFSLCSYKYTIFNNFTCFNFFFLLIFFINFIFFFVQYPCTKHGGSQGDHTQWSFAKTEKETISIFEVSFFE